jgi:hypothetical protein
VTGACNPTTVIDDTFGCPLDQKNCNGKCAGNPFEYDRNQMTYSECEYQCERIGMVVINGEEGV